MLSRNRRRDAVQIWAASAVAVGCVVAISAWFGMQPQSPPQDVTVGVSIAASHVGNPAAATKFATSLYSERPRYAAKVGTITLPTLHLSWPIFEGTSAAQLARGVGHYRQSVLPGENNNTILSGHRSTVFNRLGELRKGNLVFVKTVAGTFTYKVRGFRVVNRSNRTVIVPTKTAVLTLTTCWPFNHIGVTTQAFIVSADLVATSLAAK